MTSQELRDKFLKFFESRGHKIIPSSSLIPEDDQSVLFTTAGMQQFKPYFAGTKDVMQDFGNKNLASVQKCFRTSDIDSVGDQSHLTFFEMLGNFSLGGYGKKEAIKYAWELMTSVDWYGLPKDRFFASVFAGDREIPADKNSEKFWKDVAQNIEVKKFGREENFWPNPIWIGTCGPSSELHYILDDGSSIEVWNLVFTQYFHNKDGSFKDLGQINIDTGMGLERLAMISQGKSSGFETDLFREAIKSLEAIKKTGGSYAAEPKPYRIIVDHLRAAIFTVADGVEPSNKTQGYVVRRLIRRAMVQSRKLGMTSDEWLSNTIAHLARPYISTYPYIDNKFPIINEEITKEVDKFRKTIDRGLKEVERIEKIDGKIAFDLYQTFGFPYEVTEELFRQKGQQIDHDQFEKKFKKHQEVSRAGVGKFAGGLAGHSETEIKYHTATHLLHQALRDVLGPEVFQKGSNITAERLRFDFSFDRKMTDEEIKKVEDIINQIINEDLKVEHKIVLLEEAKKMNAIGLFLKKYTKDVSIYGVGPNYKLNPKSKDQRDRGGYYSLEFCGGPHVDITGVIGKIKITKEEAISSGIRRVRARLVP